MATIKEATINQSGNEIRNWTADFTDDLPSGGSVSSGTAIHTPPIGGGTLTPTMTIASPLVSASLSNPDTTGMHYIDILGTFSNGEVSELRVAFFVGYDATQSRAGMTAIIKKLRTLTASGPVDYTIAGVPYWSDAQLQEVLDENRIDFVEVELRQIPKTVSSSYVYLRYDAPYGYLETYDSGTAIFTLTTADGTQAGTANYSVDYTKGIITFTADQGGTAWFLSGRSYDLNSAAADVWSQKASYYQLAYDMETDGHNLKRSQMYEQAKEQESFYRAKVGAYAVQFERDDT